MAGRSRESGQPSLLAYVDRFPAPVTFIVFACPVDNATFKESDQKTVVSVGQAEWTVNRRRNSASEEPPGIQAYFARLFSASCLHHRYSIHIFDILGRIIHDWGHLHKLFCEIWIFYQWIDWKCKDIYSSLNGFCSIFNWDYYCIGDIFMLIYVSTRICVDLDILILYIVWKNGPMVNFNGTGIRKCRMRA